MRFILADVQIDKLNFQNIDFLYLGGHHIKVHMQII